MRWAWWFMHAVLALMGLRQEDCCDLRPTWTTQQVLFQPELKQDPVPKNIYKLQLLQGIERAEQIGQEACLLRGRGTPSWILLHRAWPASRIPSEEAPDLERSGCQPCL